MKTTHKEKIRLAKVMPRTQQDNLPPRYGKFATEAWDRRREAIRERVAKQQGAAHDRALLRKEAAGKIPKRSVIRRIQASLQRGAIRKARHAKYQRKHATV